MNVSNGWLLQHYIMWRCYMSHPEFISDLRKCVNNYNWSRLMFLVAVNKISESEKNNDISVNVLGIEGKRYTYTES